MFKDKCKVKYYLTSLFLVSVVFFLAPIYLAHAESVPPDECGESGSVGEGCYSSQDVFALADAIEELKIVANDDFDTPPKAGEARSFRVIASKFYSDKYRTPAEIAARTPLDVTNLDGVMISSTSGDDIIDSASGTITFGSEGSRTLTAEFRDTFGSGDASTTFDVQVRDEIGITIDVEGVTNPPVPKEPQAPGFWGVVSATGVAIFGLILAAILAFIVALILRKRKREERYEALRMRQ